MTICLTIGEVQNESLNQRHPHPTPRRIEEAADRPVRFALTVAPTTENTGSHASKAEVGTVIVTETETTEKERGKGSGTGNTETEIGKERGKGIERGITKTAIQTAGGAPGWMIMTQRSSYILNQFFSLFFA